MISQGMFPISGISKPKRVNILVFLITAKLSRNYTHLHLLIRMQIIIIWKHFYFERNVTVVMCVFILLMMNLFQIFINHWYFTFCEFMYIFLLGWGDAVLSFSCSRTLKILFCFSPFHLFLISLFLKHFWVKKWGSRFCLPVTSRVTLCILGNIFP